MTTTFRVDDMTIHRIVEQERAFSPALEFLPDLTPELLDENRAWLQPAALDENDYMRLCFQSYVVQTPDHTILVDSCIGNDKDRSARPAWHMKTDDTYMRGLADGGLSFGDIDIVMCTHLHADHVGWNTKLENGRWVPTFPNARYLFSEREFAHWSARHKETAIPAIADSVLPVIEAGRAELVRDGFEIGDHVRLMPTPGHTPGHFAVRLGRTGREAVLTGDLIHSPLQARYPEMSMFSDVDPALAATTRRSFLEEYCDSGTLCCTAHFPSPSAGKITRWGKGFRCEAVTS